MSERKVLGETNTEWKKRMLDEALKELSEWKKKFIDSGWTEEATKKFMEPYEKIIRRNFGEESGAE